MAQIHVLGRNATAHVKVQRAYESQITSLTALQKKIVLALLRDMTNDDSLTFDKVEQRAIKAGLKFN